MLIAADSGPFRKDRFQGLPVVSAQIALLYGNIWSVENDNIQRKKLRLLYQDLKFTEEQATIASHHEAKQDAQVVSCTRRTR